MLIVFGVLALVYQGYTYTTREKIIDIGPVEATTEKEKTVPLPPIVGGATLAAGVILVMASRRKVS